MERIIERIRKLAATEGRTEEETQLFAAKVQELLTKYKLEMTDIQFEEFKVSEPVVRTFVDWAKHDLRPRRRRISWIEDLAGVVARAYQCRHLVHVGTSYITFVGRKNDTEVAEYVLVTLVRSVEVIAEKAYVKYFYECRDAGDERKARGFKAAFLIGFVQRINARLQQKIDEMNKDVVALVRFSMKEVDAEIAKIRTTYGLTRPRHHQEGMRRGWKAADEVDLDGKALKTQDRKKLPGD